MKRIFLLTMLLPLLFVGCNDADDKITEEQTTSRSFEEIRNNEVLLQYFFSSMPKGGDLHNHLTGSVYAETYFKIAVDEGMWLDRKTYILYAKADASKPAGCIQLTSTMSNYHEIYRECIDHWSVRNYQYGNQPSLAPDEFFFATFDKFSASAANQYFIQFVKELKQRAAEENVSYIETMLRIPSITNPGILDNATLKQSLASAINSKDEAAFETVLAAIYSDWETNADIQQSVENALNFANSTHEATKNSYPEVTVRFQLYGLRNIENNLSVFFQLYAGFKACVSSMAANGTLVGMNIVQMESGEYSLRNYWGHMQMFKFLKEKCVQNGKIVNTSIHAGELTLGLTYPEEMKYHIASAVRDAKANRIGHGVDIAFESDAANLLKEMAEKKIAVEINLTSNEFILGVTGNEHPIRLYLANKVPIVLSTDDAGVLRTNLTQQYVLAALRYPELTYLDFKQFVFNSITYSFLQDDEKAERVKDLEMRFEKFEREFTL